jgi:hypothetical protein
MPEKKPPAKKKPPGPPFVGEAVMVAFPDGSPSLAGTVTDARDGFIRLAPAVGSPAWINLDHVVLVVISADDAPADDSPEALAASLEAAGSPYGPVSVKVADVPQATP